jgi:hypothetical protein
MAKKTKYYFDEDDTVYAEMKTEEEVWTKIRPTAEEYFGDFFKKWNGKSGKVATSVKEGSRGCIACAGPLRVYDTTKAGNVILFCADCGKTQELNDIFGMTPKQRAKMEEMMGDAFVDNADVLYRTVSDETLLRHELVMKQRAEALQVITKAIEDNDENELLSTLQDPKSTLSNVFSANKTKYLTELTNALQAEKIRISQDNPSYTGVVYIQFAENGTSPGLLKTIREVNQIEAIQGINTNLANGNDSAVLQHLQTPELGVGFIDPTKLTLYLNALKTASSNGTITLTSADISNAVSSVNG